MLEKRPPSVLGLDIGGANVKAFHSDGIASRFPFAVWENPQGLPDMLQRVIDSLPNFQKLLVTMTAELCDCFQTKREGIGMVLDAVEQACSGHREVQVWQTIGRWVSTDQARKEPLLTAASNWNAFATWVGRNLSDGGHAIAIDIGSTTTDIIPLSEGVPIPLGHTDYDRLVAHELIYSGIRRTPVSALVSEVPYRAGSCAVAAECFATTDDVYLVLGWQEEDRQNCDTSDGQPRTYDAATVRLARMICADLEVLRIQEIHRMAEAIAEAQKKIFLIALEEISARFPGKVNTIVVAGEGEQLVLRWLKDTRWSTTPKVAVGSLLTSSISESICAYALTQLAKS
ncbi:MAG: hydantoinase/oxoprolinase family protein [Planctomycetota bacterium]|nr:hydantoinase/oxoprolinase family protein [Planctomycetota bacterium]